MNAEKIKYIQDTMKDKYVLLTSTGDRVFLNSLQLQKEPDESMGPCIPILNTRVFFMSEWLRNRIG